MNLFQAMDALKMVDPMLNISSIIDDVDKFLHLTDASIINVGSYDLILSVICIEYSAANQLVEGRRLS